MCVLKSQHTVRIGRELQVLCGNWLASNSMDSGRLSWSMVALVTALLIPSGSYVEVSALEEVVSISRSGDKDTYRVSSSNGSCSNESCAGNFTTYLVEERECENDTTLQKSE